MKNLPDVLELQIEALIFTGVANRTIDIPGKANRTI
jgi:hypothetical protein